MYKEGLQIKSSVAPKLLRVTVCCVINASPDIFTAQDAATGSDKYQKHKNAPLESCPAC